MVPYCKSYASDDTTPISTSYFKLERNYSVTYTSSGSYPLQEKHQTVEKPKSKFHTFSYWLNYILADPPEPFFAPTVEKPLTKLKVIRYINVKLARAPPRKY